MYKGQFCKYPIYICGHVQLVYRLCPIKLEVKGGDCEHQWIGRSPSHKNKITDNIYWGRRPKATLGRIIFLFLVLSCKYLLWNAPEFEQVRCWTVSAETTIPEMSGEKVLESPGIQDAISPFCPLAAASSPVHW